MLFAAALTADGIFMPKVSAYTPLPGRSTDSFAQLKRALTTPQRIMKYFNECHIRYRVDEEGFFEGHDGVTRLVGMDFMQSPLDTYLSGVGDCKDFAAFAYECLDSYREKKIVGFFWRESKTGHHFCAVREQTGWSYLGNDEYRTGYSNIREMIEKTEQGWEVYYEAVLDECKGTGERVSNEVYRDELAVRKYHRHIENFK